MRPESKLAPQEMLAAFFDGAAFTAAQAEGSALLLARGRVAGRMVHVALRDESVLQGALTEADLGQLTGAVRRAEAERAVLLLSFGGMALAPEDDLASMAALAGLHRAFAGARMPRLALVTGPCLGPDALLAASADVTVITEDAGFLAAGGPGLVQRVTNAMLSGEEIGGAAIHAASGLAQAVPHDLAALLWLRRLVDLLPDAAGDAGASADPVTRVEPGLATLVPEPPTEPYDMRALLRRIADDGLCLELSPAPAPHLITALARFGGRAAAIIANDPSQLGGVLDAAALAKAARFAAWSRRLGVPLVTVIDTPGLLPGPDQEKAGLLAGAGRLALDPAVSLVIRHAIGPAALLMGLGQGAAYRWPSARIGLRGGAARAQLPLTPGLFGEEIAPGETRRVLAAALVAAR